jgi:hypothetical protein
MPYAATRRLMRELKELRTSPPEGIRVQLSEESALDVVGIIQGPGAFFSLGQAPHSLNVEAFHRGHTVPRRLLSREI